MKAEANWRTGVTVWAKDDADDVVSFPSVQTASGSSLSEWGVLDAGVPDGISVDSLVDSSRLERRKVWNREQRRKEADRLAKEKEQKLEALRERCREGVVSPTKRPKWAKEAMKLLRKWDEAWKEKVKAKAAYRPYDPSTTERDLKKDLIPDSFRSEDELRAMYRQRREANRNKACVSADPACYMSARSTRRLTRYEAPLSREDAILSKEELLEHLHKKRASRSRSVSRTRDRESKVALRQSVQ